MKHKVKKKRNNIRRYILGTLLGAAFGFLANQLSTNFGSQCMLLCQPKIAMAYFGLVGFVLSLDKG
jgi:uncharacterized membrane protein YccC